MDETVTPTVEANVTVSANAVAESVAEANKSEAMTAMRMGEPSF